MYIVLVFTHGVGAWNLHTDEWIEHTFIQHSHFLTKILNYNVKSKHCDQNLDFILNIFLVKIIYGFFFNLPVISVFSFANIY